MSKKMQILLVDDETDLINVIKFHLLKRGYEVVTAGNGREAFERLKSFVPDLIILDVNMPEMGGLEFYRQNLTSYGRPKHPVLFLTARDSLETLLEEVGANGFLSKPFEMVDLIAAIERIMSTQKNNGLVFLLDLEENVFAQNICQGLRSQRYEVVFVEDFKVLEGRAAARRPDFILLEYMQEGIKGDELIRDIKNSSSLKTVPLLVYSYSGFEAYRGKSLQAGADVYLGKPADYKIFVEAIEKFQFDRRKNP